MKNTSHIIGKCLDDLALIGREKGAFDGFKGSQDLFFIDECPLEIDTPSGFEPMETIDEMRGYRKNHFLRKPGHSLDDLDAKVVNVFTELGHSDEISEPFSDNFKVEDFLNWPDLAPFFRKAKTGITRASTLDPISLRAHLYSVFEPISASSLMAMEQQDEDGVKFFGIKLKKSLSDRLRDLYRNCGGIMSFELRKKVIEKFRFKKLLRGTKVRYTVRQQMALGRSRVKGRFSSAQASQEKEGGTTTC